MQILQSDAERLLHLRSAGRVGPIDGIAPGAIANALREHLAAEGYRQGDSPYGDPIVYRVDPATGAARALSSRAFRRELAPLALDVLGTLGRSGARGARRATDTARTLEQGARGAESWRRKLSDFATARLVDVTEAELAAASAQPSTPAPVPAQSRTDRNTARRKRHEAEATELVPRWLATATATPGTHTLAALWNDFRAQVAASERVPAEHGARWIGRTTFYGILSEVADVRAIGGHKRVLVIPEPITEPHTKEEPSMDPAAVADRVIERVLDTLTAETLADLGDVRAIIRERLANGDPVGALLAQREAHEHMAATGTDGVVLDLAEARERRGLR